ncbi:ankyrin repeat domain-containing protein [Treponema sp.]|uniref:ankyrin repeat domain-containing protein n=1 Tax=Treponema sp. TaxID=166 RepID=UPI00388DD7F0
MLKKICYLSVLGFFSFICCIACSMEKEYLITNVKIYKDTSVYKLAKAVKMQRVKKIKKFLNDNPDIIYDEDPIYKCNVLHWAVGMEKYDSVKALLEAGMDPNVTSSRDNRTPLFIASSYSFIDSEAKTEPRFVKLLLDYGADANIAMYFNDPQYLHETLSDINGCTPLMNACESLTTNFEKVKLLVEQGKADINARDEYGETAVIKALLSNDVKVAYYLIVEKKAQIVDPYYPDFFIQQSIINEGRLVEPSYPVELLREYWIYPLDSEEYRIKMEIIKEFKRQGVDYFATEIPNWVLDRIKKKYPDTWEEYIKVY